MGMPKPLREMVAVRLQKITSGSAFKFADLVLEMSIHPEYKGCIEALMNKKGLEAGTISEGLLPHYLRYLIIPSTKTPQFPKMPTRHVDKSLARVHATWYVGLDGDQAVEKEVTVASFYWNKLMERNKAMRERDKPELQRRRKFKRLTETVYHVRAFPPTLAALIFHRDSHTCQMCLRGKEKLQEVGLHLEADHVIAYADGGKTCFGNGQTLCSECNKIKHHIKDIVTHI